MEISERGYGMILDHFNMYAIKNLNASWRLNTHGMMKDNVVLFADKLHLSSVFQLDSLHL